jgi:hypothetical protein
MLIMCPTAKAKPVARRGRKATGLDEIAGLPGNQGSPVFSLQGRLATLRILQYIRYGSE